MDRAAVKALAAVMVVYVLGSPTGPHKVGIANDVRRRMGEIRRRLPALVSGAAVQLMGAHQQPDGRAAVAVGADSSPRAAVGRQPVPPLSQMPWPAADPLR